MRQLQALNNQSLFEQSFAAFLSLNFPGRRFAANAITDKSYNSPCNDYISWDIIYMSWKSEISVLLFTSVCWKVFLYGVFFRKILISAYIMFIFFNSKNTGLLKFWKDHHFENWDFLWLSTLGQMLVIVIWHGSKKR